MTALVVVTSPSLVVLVVIKDLILNLTPHFTNRIPIVDLETIKNVDFLADDSSKGEVVDLLIGNDYYFSFIRNERIEIGDVIIINTDFGWIVSCKGEHKEDNALSVVTYYCQCHDIDYAYFNEPDLPRN